MTKEVELDGNLAGLGGEQRARDADEIAEVQVPEDVELLVAEHILLRIDLEPPALVADVDEHALAHVAMRGDAAGQGHFAAFGVMGAGLRRRFPSGVNLFRNGSMPLARNAASLALRCSINELVSSIAIAGGDETRNPGDCPRRKRHALRPIPALQAAPG